MGRPMRIRIRDFQSIEDIEMSIDGFTVVVGRSNIGKSAIVRAIDGALTNLAGDSFVRVGAHHTEVEIDCPEIQLCWKKGGGFNDYVINGESFESVGRGAPPVIGDAGFREVEVSRATISVQVASQFSPIFLLDPTQVSGSLAAEVVSDIGRLGELQEALRNASKDRRGLENVQRVRRKDLVNARAELQSYADLDADLALGDRLRDLRRDIDLLQGEIEDLSYFSVEYFEALRITEMYDGISGVALNPWEGDSLVNEVSSLEIFERIHQETLQDVLRYEGVTSVDIPEVEIESDLKAITSLERFSQVASDVQVTLEVLGVIPDVPDVPDFDLREIQDLITLRQQWTELSESLPRLKDSVSSLDEDLKDAHEEIHRVLVEAQICPLCESEISE